jgi:hypothetical protein
MQDLPELREYTTHLTEHMRACKGHMQPPYPCPECARREREGFDVPCVMLALTIESML